MPAEVTREEFEGRVGVLEREVEGEKMVTRHVLEQSRRNGDDLAILKTRMDRVELRLDRVEQKVDGLSAEVVGLRGMISGLTANLPTMIGDAVRAAFRERDSRTRGA